MNLGPHAAFIGAAYVSVAAGLCGLVAWLISDGRRQQAALDDLEARGIRRRTSQAPVRDATTPDAPT